MISNRNVSKIKFPILNLFKNIISGYKKKPNIFGNITHEKQEFMKIRYTQINRLEDENWVWNEFLNVFHKLLLIC